MFMRNNNGFTLIEVLIALAILSIALTAIIQSTSQHIRDTAYLQNKMIATWVAKQVMSEIHLGVIKISETSNSLEQETEMLGRQWQWKARLTTTPNSHIKEVDVDVFSKVGGGKLVSLMGYIYAA